jgi:hypothetical protein
VLTHVTVGERHVIGGDALRPSGAGEREEP